MRTPHFAPETVRAVVFDIGGVFLYPDYAAVRSLLAELGLAIDGEPAHDAEVEAGVEAADDLVAFRRAHHAGVAALAEAADLTRTEGLPEHTEDFWLIYDHAYARSLGVSEEGIDRIRLAIRTEWAWSHSENIQAFHRLAAGGMPVAIVSNNDGTAAKQMRDHGVCQIGEGPLASVRIIVDSGVLGIAKPDPRIMAPAIEALGLSAEHVLYVGDTVHADVVGATNAGMQVVQLDPFDHHAGYPHPRVRDVAHLVSLLTERD